MKWLKRLFSKRNTSVPNESIPDERAEWDEVFQFITSFQQHVPATFQQRWGTEYQENARALWSRLASAFRAGQPLDAAADELLLCLAYDLAVAPYIGTPQSQQLAFWQWLLDGLRR